MKLINLKRGDKIYYVGVRSGNKRVEVTRNVKPNGAYSGYIEANGFVFYYWPGCHHSTASAYAGVYIYTSWLRYVINRIVCRIKNEALRAVLIHKLNWIWR